MVCYLVQLLFWLCFFRTVGKEPQESSRQYCGSLHTAALLQSDAPEHVITSATYVAAALQDARGAEQAPPCHLSWPFARDGAVGWGNFVAVALLSSLRFHSLLGEQQHNDECRIVAHVFT